MVTASLRRQLEQLLVEISRLETADPDARRALKDVADEIEQVLAATEPDVQSVRERIEETALSFEASHPRFAGLLSEVTDALAKLGI
jgi:predicted  nucleic acid-binding Zn-ribbon protein